MIDKEKFIKMIDELYEHKGLDSEGIPKPETLKSLGIEKEPSHLV
jgi:aldehyde:ferredoxin oxidoreductase